MIRALLKTDYGLSVSSGTIDGMLRRAGALFAAPTDPRQRMVVDSVTEALSQVNSNCMDGRRLDFRQT